jgi:hypothetical protein
MFIKFQKKNKIASMNISVFLETNDNGNNVDVGGRKYYLYEVKNKI